MSTYHFERIPLEANDVQVAILRGCWSCGSHAIFVQPDEGMKGTTDEIVCRNCGERQ